MIIIGADFHPEFQQIALVDTDTGEFQEKRLGHPQEAEQFYRALAGAEGKGRDGGQRACALVRRPLVSERKCENLAGNLVELVGIEPTTSSLRTMRSPS